MSAAIASVPLASRSTKGNKTKSVKDTPEALGVCVVHLGGLNYFFPVDENCPVVSRIGSVIGHLHLTIEPFVAPTRSNGTRDPSLFEPYQSPDIDRAEDQVYDFMDRTIEYRITLHDIIDLAARKYSRISFRYAFFRDASEHTEPFAVAAATTRIDHVSRHIVDVTEPFVKYLTGNNFVLELYGWE